MLDEIVADLIRRTGDLTLRIVKVEKGSLRVTNSLSKEGAKKLQRLHDAAELDVVCGCEVIELVAPTATVPLGTRPFGLSLPTGSLSALPAAASWSAGKPCAIMYSPTERATSRSPGTYLRPCRHAASPRIAISAVAARSSASHEVWPPGSRRRAYGRRVLLASALI